MTLFLVSPAEPPLIRTLGKTSAAVERHGADVLFASKVLGGIVGIQRKQYEDLLSSEADGRLQREVPQLQQCRAAYLIVEGKPSWAVNGKLNHRYLDHWTREGYRSLLRSVQARGIIVEHSDDQADTVALIESIARWTAKGEHRSLDRRPKVAVGRWGEKTHRATQSHVLQGVDGIGPSQAEAILDYFGGVLPLQWSVGEAELRAVKGLGPKRVAALVKTIPVGVVGKPDVV